MFSALKQTARRLTRELSALSLACRDPRVPWYAKALVLFVIAYAVSPIDLIPDPIPVLGYLDDLLIVPLGIALALRMIPAGVIAECRVKALDQPPRATALSWTIAGAIVLFWIGLSLIVVRFGWRYFRGK
ncbi:MAG: DUF1232 domain-containing protein [Candidatus Hydrogenedentes bacterium]|nr:DUF1232 domain-containing protein [Candidatus Hydrogenedentota bacterium]